MEAAAHRIPEVVSAAVLPPSGKKSALLAIVTDLSPQQVLERMHEQMEDFKTPRRCLVLDSLPLSGNGKVGRKELAVLVEHRPRTDSAPVPSG